MSLDMSFGTSIEAGVQPLFGASVSLSNSKANPDLVDSDNSKSTAFKPQFSRKFEAGGEITLESKLDIPISSRVRIDLIPLDPRDWRIISVINEPGIAAAATCSTEGECSNGVEYSLDFYDDTRLDLFGLNYVDLFSYKPP